MKKLVNGIVEFRKNIRPSYRETFAKLALGQSPDALFIACSDSRVVPNLFASTDPGDLFVIRNVGNLVPPCGGEHGLSAADESEAAAIEFALENLKVSDIIICGHSDCGAMQSLLKGREHVNTPNLKGWLRHGEDALATFEKTPNQSMAGHNHLSQLNVLTQIEHLKSYPIVRNRLAAKKLRLHAWWFELGQALVHCFDPNTNNFVELDEKMANQILNATI